MIHKWLEEWHDTMLYLGAVFVLLGFFLYYWKGEYQNRYAELVLQEFLCDVAVCGKITSEEYESLVSRIKGINWEYEVDISCIEYEQKPVYALIPEEEMTQYYMSRNVKKEAVFYSFEPDVKEEIPELLCLQKESGAELLASSQNKLPLPNEDAVWKIDAVKPIQKVYQGENLITMCHVVSAIGEYYIEAEPASAMSSGTVHLKLLLDSKEYQIPVQVYCLSRIVICENGHKVVNSEDILADGNTIGKELCPYCNVIPEYISCSTGLVQKATGTTLSKQDVWITVVYMNGKSEIVTADSPEWQDSYDKNYCGIQDVTVQYRGKEASFLLVSENAGCQQCGGVCNDRCYEDYISFPYCTKCMSEIELFSGKVYDEEQISTSKDLIMYLETNREKVFKPGDFVRLYLSKGGKYVSYLQEKVKQRGKMGKN